MTAKSKSFVKGAAILAVSGIICKVVGAVYRIPLSNMIGQEGMGNYQMVYPVYSLLLVLSTSGLPIAISKLVSEKRARGDIEGARRVYHVSMVSLVILGLVTSLALFAAGDLLAVAFGMPSAAISFKIIAPSLIFVAVVSAYRGYFQGMQMMTPTAVSQVVEQICKLLAGLYFAGQWVSYGPEYGAAGAILGVTIGEGVSFVMMFCFFHGHRHKQHYKPLGRERGKFRETLEQVARIALPVTVGSCVMPIVSAIDSMVVMRVLTGSGYTQAAASSLFGLLNGFVHPLVNMPAVFSGAVAISLVPAISAARAQKRRELVGYQTSFGLRLSILIGLPCAVGFFLLAEPILGTRYHSLSPDDLTRAAGLLRLMCPGILFLSVIQIQTGVLQGLGKTVIPVLNMAFGSVVKVFLGVALIRIPSVNIEGAAIGSMVCFALAALLNTSAAMGYGGVRWNTRDLLLRPLLATAGMGAGLLVLYRVLTPLGQGRALILSVLASAVIYAILLLITGCIRREDMRYFPGGGRIAGVMQKTGIWR